jgi:hypothetical protein
MWKKFATENEHDLIYSRYDNSATEMITAAMS